MSNPGGIDRSELIDFLLLPSSYPHSPEEIIHIQTHASDVFIAGHCVYKVKKSVNLGFLDFSTLEKRKHFCEAEVELNRRLCADAYIGVWEIKLRDGSLSINGEGETVEYAVKMRRLPEDKFMKNMLREGEITEKHLSRLARKLVKFYNSQKPRPEVREYGRPEKIKVNIDENLDTSGQFVGKTITPAAFEALRFYNQRFFDTKSNLFSERRDKGFIKDCHGDLHLEHVNFGSRDICIYDCIEFNERFRYIDIASDVAFLAMDLDHNGYYGFSNYFISEIVESMKDETARLVIDFYKNYRAFVRGKVESIKSTEEEVPEDEKARSVRMAGEYFSLALRYAALGSRPAVIVTFGIIGSGKSTLAGKLGEELSASVVASDYVRKEITATGTNERKDEGYEKGIYTEEITEKTYAELISRSMKEIERKHVVILDASFSKRRWRKMLMNKAAETGLRVFFLRTIASKEALRERLIEREKRGDSVSDATVDILERFASGFEEPEEIEKTNYFEVDTERPPGESLTLLLKDMIAGGIANDEY